MRYIEYFDLIDKTNWQRGVWDKEPDKIQFADRDTGLPCLIRRNGSGNLCGYVGVTEGHPYFDKELTNYDFCYNLDVHGGITYNDFCIGDESTGICHIPDEGEEHNVYWLGFDMGHLHDLTPSYPYGWSQKDCVYRDIEYAKNECSKLAKQLIEINSAKV